MAITLQQMRYVLSIAEHGSISAAAHSLFISQAALSNALKDVEREIGVIVFKRSNRGIETTLEGLELLGLMRQVVQQDDLFISRYGKGRPAVERLAVSSQHYAIGADAFAQLIAELELQGFSFSFRETRTEEVIDDVRCLRSNIGIVYLSAFNQRIILRELEAANISFTPLFETKPHALVSCNHPLAQRTYVTAKDLSAYPRVNFEQGAADSAYYAEEPLADITGSGLITVRDRGTMASIIAQTNCFTIATGAQPADMGAKIVDLKLRTSEYMHIGYLTHKQMHLSATVQRFIVLLQEAAQRRYGSSA